MHIVISTSGYPPSQGGAETICRQYAEGLAARGHRVTVIAPDLLYTNDFYSLRARPAPRQEDAGTALPVRRVPFLSPIEVRLAAAILQATVNGSVRRFVERSLLWLTARRFERRLKRLIVRCRPEAVLAMVHLHPNVRVSLNAAREAGARAVVMPLLHAEDADWPFAGVKRCVAIADAVVTLTRFEAAQFVRDYDAQPERVFVVGVGIDPAAEAPQPAAEPPTILFVGRKTVGKGLADLSDAVRLLDGRRQDFRVALVGARADDTDAQVARFRAILGDRLVSVDDASPAEKERWLRDCAMLVLPSHKESFGIVILEGWSHGKPVVAMDFAVSREIVDDGADGLLVPIGDAEAMAGAIGRLLDSAALRTRLGEAGLRKVRTKHSWRAVLDQLEAACGVDGAASRSV